MTYKYIKNYVLLILALFVSTGLMAQKKKDNSKKADTASVASAPAVTMAPASVQDNIFNAYRLAVALHDAGSATSLAMQLAVIPGQDNWDDTLLYLYVGQNNYASAYFLAKALNTAKPNLFYLEALAQSEKNLNLTTDALGHYADLAKATKNIYYVYQTAELEYSLGRIGECTAHTDQVIDDTSSLRLKTNVSTPNNSYQNVCLRAAALNLRGALAHELKDDKAAAQYFTAALKIEPKYGWADANLQTLNKQGTEAPKTNATPPAHK